MVWHEPHMGTGGPSSRGRGSDSSERVCDGWWILGVFSWGDILMNRWSFTSLTVGRAIFTISLTYGRMGCNLTEVDARYVGCFTVLFCWVKREEERSSRDSAWNIRKNHWNSSLSQMFPQMSQMFPQMSQIFPEKYFLSFGFPLEKRIPKKKKWLLSSDKKGIPKKIFAWFLFKVELERIFDFWEGGGFLYLAFST